MENYLMGGRSKEFIKDHETFAKYKLYRFEVRYMFQLLDMNIFC